MAYIIDRIQQIEMLDTAEKLTDDTYFPVVNSKIREVEGDEISVAVDEKATPGHVLEYVREKALDGMDARLNEKIDATQAELNEKIDATQAELNEKIDGVEQTLTEKSDDLQAQVTENKETVQAVSDRILTVGDGTKFLSDDGTYKTVAVSGGGTGEGQVGGTAGGGHELTQWHKTGDTLNGVPVWERVFYCYCGVPEETINHKYNIVSGVDVITGGPMVFPNRNTSNENVLILQLTGTVRNNKNMANETVIQVPSTITEKGLNIDRMINLELQLDVWEEAIYLVSSCIEDGQVVNDYDRLSNSEIIVTLRVACV